MRYYLLMIVFFLGGLLMAQLPPQGIFNQDTLTNGNIFLFNHSASLAVIPAGTSLRSGLTLTQNTVLVTTTSGFQEATGNTLVRYTVSTDNGGSFSFPQNLTDSAEVNGDSTSWNMALYVGDSGRVYSFYLFQPGDGGGSSGIYPLSLRFTYTDDLGQNWSKSTEASFNLPIFTDSLKFVGPKGTPVRFHPDSINFPVYYRYVGNPKIYRGSVVADADLTSFHWITDENRIEYNQLDYVEPTSVLIGDSTYTFARNGTGQLIYESSPKNARIWSQIKRLNLPNPSSPIDITECGSGVYMSLNYSHLDRKDLVLLEIDSNLIPKAFVRNTVISNNVEQVSYPYIIADANDVHWVYTVMSYDTISNLRFASIHYKRIDHSNFTVLDLNVDGDTLVSDMSLYGSACLKTSGYFNNKVLTLTHENELFEYDWRNGSEQNLSTSLGAVYDFSIYDSNAVIVTDSGIESLYNGSSQLLVSGNFRSWKIWKTNSFICVARQREYKLYDSTGTLLSYNGVPQIGPNGITSNLNNQIIEVFEDSTGLKCVTNLGKIYHYDLNAQSFLGFCNCTDEIRSVINLGKSFWLGFNKGTSMWELYQNCQPQASFNISTLSSDPSSILRNNDNDSNLFAIGGQILRWDGIKIDSIGVYPASIFSYVHPLPNDSLLWIDIFGRVGKIGKSNISLMENLVSPHFRVFPNPVNPGQAIEIDWVGKNLDQFIIYDLSGKVVRMGKGKIFAPKSKGTYILQVRDSDQMLKSKILIVN